MRILYYIILIILVSGCEKSTTWDLNANDKRLLIVDGMITNEFKQHTIRLTYSMNSSSDLPEPVVGATVTVQGKLRTFTFDETPIGSGNYVSTDSFVGIVNLAYQLTIVSKNRTYTAETKMVPITPSHPLTFELINADDASKNKDSMYRIAYVSSFYEVDNPAMYEVNIDWSMLPEYAAKPVDSCRAKLYYYSLPSVDVSQSFSPNAQKITFPKGSVILERKYSLNRKHAEFIRSLLFETQWRGGLFDEAASNVKTNLSEGALGYFAACVVLEATLIVK